MILGVIGAYFASEVRMYRMVSARAEVQDKVRFVLTAVTQDLQLAGASRYVAENTTRQPVAVASVASFALCSATSPCVASVPGGVRDGFTARYVTSLRPVADACRSVGYSFSGDVLRRSDVVCGVAANPQELASGVLALNLRYVCSDGTEQDTAACPPATFTRAAKVAVYAQSSGTVSGASSASLTLGDAAVACPAEHVCSGLQQEIAMPNLKDK
ncbi:hypothetical protein [Deinococcus petrolearius]|uniref:Uncharacterized protein n=1 Tax=Deinococcus petrolearius TaxID=1751295 RepID=A0ABW1DGP9_9DEIO